MYEHFAHANTRQTPRPSSVSSKFICGSILRHAVPEIEVEKTIHLKNTKFEIGIVNSDSGVRVFLFYIDVWIESSFS